MRLLVSLFVMFVNSTFAGAGELAVIVNAELGVSSLTKDEVASHFLKKKAAWESGGTVDPISYPDDHPLRAAFCKQILGMSVQEEERYWVEQGYSGGVKPPAKVQAEPMVLALSALKKGAIAYVNAASVTDSKVKVVFKINY
jgi:hypothetical protein